MTKQQTNTSKPLEEVSNMIAMLEEELEGYRKRGNPDENYDHRIVRMFYTLATAIKELAKDDH